MTKSEVLALLKEHKNARGVEHWNKMGEATGGLASYGIGLTQLRKLAKKVGRDHKLALQLWKTKNYDAKVVALLIDEPGEMTREQVENQVEELNGGMLSHVFSSCDATLPKVEFSLELAKEWIQSEDEIRRRCGWGLLYELSKNKRNKELTDEFLFDCIERIATEIADEEDLVRVSMGSCLMGIGKRTKGLNKVALKVAKAIGPIEYEGGGAGCEPFDVAKHLSSPALQEKLKG